jgi:hypothetical protein
MKKARFTKAQRESFLARAGELLLLLSARQEGDEFVLETKAGRLRLHPSANQEEGLGTVFGRFDDPEAARKLVDCNRFSGKWNHHYFEGWTVETAIDDLAARLRKVLP